MTPTSPGTSAMVVLRFRDKRLVKGTTHDFHPDRAEFHLYEQGDESRPALKVPLADLKAVFFVKTFQGDRSHVRSDDLTSAKGQGRKLTVTFQDGEQLRGFTVGYNPAKQGFFVIPADAEANNLRVFVVNAAVAKIEWWR